MPYIHALDELQDHLDVYLAYISNEEFRKKDFDEMYIKIPDAFRDQT
jgi:hypothetical protein